MDNTIEINVRLQTSKLESRLELNEIEIYTLNRTINSYLASPESREIAAKRREALLYENSAMREELEQMRKAYPEAAKR